MNCTFRCPLVGFAALLAAAGTIAFAQAPAKDTKPTAPKTPAAKAPAATPPTKGDPTAGQMPELPPGMTAEDMQACMEAATPGPMHAFLAEGVGTWAGKNTMWMTPEAKPVNSECTATTTVMMDGKFIKCEIAGDMPGMGPFNGFGLYGYDNVGKTFQSTWIDNCGTGMMQGKGELSSDGKTLTWNYTFNCPIQKKPTVMREVEHITGKDTKTLTMYGPDKTGKEFKMMEIAFTRMPGAAAAVNTDRSTGH